MSTRGPNWPNTTDPLVPGENVTGFSFTANVEDDSPKDYAYETVENGWAQDNGGFLAALGVTQSGGVAADRTTWSQVKALFD